MKKGPGRLLPDLCVLCQGAPFSSTSGLLKCGQLPLSSPFTVVPAFNLFGGVDKFPSLGIPFELLPRPVADVPQMANRHTAGAHLNIANRSFATLDAVEPIALMPGRLVELYRDLLGGGL